MFSLHHFPEWIRSVAARLTRNWNTKRSMSKALTYQSASNLARGFPREMPSVPSYNFTLNLNPVTYKLKATEGYRLSKTINAKITNLLYIDMKMYAASEGKLG